MVLQITARRSEEPPPSVGFVPPTEKKIEQRNGVAANLRDGTEKGEVEEREWNDEDFEILKKQIAKHPVGTPKRWEQIAEAFGEGTEKRPGAEDSFTQFLRQRKMIDKRAEVTDPELSAPDSSENGEAKDGDANGGGGRS
ncbi:hypothetical protein Taro_002530 [Colocasia esculenta]|uniref:Myb-like domain-containing protein n=1 Tax=Colocasia esculenta TaxID=4460 RepID=A0A843THD1_COLES|nr:hypothetical protein [Colocasia esculenta]